MAATGIRRASAVRCPRLLLLTVCRVSRVRVWVCSVSKSCTRSTALAQLFGANRCTTVLSVGGPTPTILQQMARQVDCTRRTLLIRRSTYRAASLDVSYGCVTGYYELHTPVKPPSRQVNNPVTKEWTKELYKRAGGLHAAGILYRMQSRE